VLVGLAVRLPWFDDALYGDEVQAFWDVSGRSLGDTLHLLAGNSTELSPPLFFVFAWVSDHLFGASAESLRIVSLAAGLATIPLTYLLGRRTVGVRAGLLGAAFVAVSPFMIFYSSQARPYALMVMLCLVSTLALLRAVRDGGRSWWLLYAATSCAAMYTHYTSVFPLAVQLGWALVTQPGARRCRRWSSTAARPAPTSTRCSSRSRCTTSASTSASSGSARCSSPCGPCLGTSRPCSP
jgi:uncharacterized membrane protein